jgi:hypothetical protein
MDAKKEDYPVHIASPDGEWMLEIAYESGCGGYNLSYAWWKVSRPDERTASDEFFYCNNLADGDQHGYDVAQWVEDAAATLEFSVSETSQYWRNSTPLPTIQMQLNEEECYLMDHHDAHELSISLVCMCFVLVCIRRSEDAIRSAFCSKSRNA